MLDIHMIREKPDIVREDLKKRKDPEKLKWFEDLLRKDEEWRNVKQEAEQLRANRNKLSRDIALLKKSGKNATAKLKEASLIPHKIQKTEERQNSLKKDIDSYLMRLPNILHESVPYGKDDSENQEVRKWGKAGKPKFELKPHGEWAEDAGLADFESAGKVAGKGFYYLKGDLALLNQALMQLAIQRMSAKGYVLVEPPLMLRRKPYEGVTDLDDFETMMYKVEDEDLYLVATSEHPIAAMMMDRVLDPKELPLKLIGFSPCFRKEIGSHGIDERGTWRTHQFWKVEQFVFCKPEDSWKYHEELIKNAEDIWKEMGIPFRVVNICTGDIGIVAAKKYDLEAWLPRQGKYGEVVSCSNCTDYQARRLNIKYQTPEGNRLVHTLNSTAIATSRAMTAILENFQNADGTVSVPKPLQPFMGGKKKIGGK